MRYFLELSFDGTCYHGWQKQVNANTVQEVLKERFSTVLGEPIDLTGAGRTDTGVHAAYYMAHFDCNNEKLHKNPHFLRRINGYLPPDIAIHALYPVIDGAHARFDALSRTYEYRISRRKEPFTKAYSYLYTGPLDLELMNQTCQFLIHHKDFSCFCKKGSDEVNHDCTVTEAIWKEENYRLTFRITANRFLRNMVRAIVGTQLEAGRGKISLDGFKRILQEGNRSQAGESVPGKGLFLTDIVYPEEIYLKD